MDAYKGAWRTYFSTAPRTLAQRGPYSQGLEDSSPETLMGRLDRGILKTGARSPPVNEKGGRGNLIRLAHSRLTSPGRKASCSFL